MGATRAFCARRGAVGEARRRGNPIGMAGAWLPPVAAKRPRHSPRHGPRLAAAPTVAHLGPGTRPWGSQLAHDASGTSVRTTKPIDQGDVIAFLGAPFTHGVDRVERFEIFAEGEVAPLARQGAPARPSRRDSRRARP